MKLARAAFAVAIGLVAPLARADAELDVTLHDGKLFVDAGDVHEEVPVACAQPIAFVRRDARVFVACGEEGLAIYALEGTHLTFGGRVAHDASCIGVTREGTCVLGPRAAPVQVETPVAPLPPPPPRTAEEQHRASVNKARKQADAAAGAKIRDIGIGLLIGSLASLAAATTLTFVEIGAGQSNSGYGLAEALLVIGAFTAPCVGVPFYFYGAHKVSRAYAYATPTGGGIRVTF